MEGYLKFRKSSVSPRPKELIDPARSQSANTTKSSNKWLKRKKSSTGSTNAIHYKIYYRKLDKSKFSALEEGTLKLTDTLIIVRNVQGEDILEKPNREHIRSFSEEVELKIGEYEIEIIQQIAKTEVHKQVQDFLESRKSLGSEKSEKENFRIPDNSLVLDEELGVYVEPFLVKKLRPHQIQGVEFMYDCISGKKSPGHNGCILADSMGLGKTLTSLALIYTLTKKNAHYPSSIKKCIVICPATLIINWKEECFKWLSNRVTPVTCIGSKKEKQKQVQIFEKGNSPLLIISYDSFLKYSCILDTVCDLFICDEGHKIKNHNTKKYQALDNMHCIHRVILTGTPLQNYIREFYTCVNLVNRNILGMWNVFRETYCSIIMKAQQPDAYEWEKELAASRSEELWDATKDFMLRRTGSIIEGHLPPKNEYMIFLKIEPLQEQLYLSFLHSSVADDAKEYGYNVNVLALISMLRKITNHPDLVYFKEPNSMALHDDWVLAMSIFPTGYKNLKEKLEFSGKLKFSIEITRLCTEKRQKLIIVSNFTRTLDIIEEHFDLLGYDHMRLDGNTPTGSRMRIVSDFNSRTKPVVLLLSSKAGGCGLNLIGASRLIMFDNDWNPSNDKQAMARIWRDGQKHEVHIYRLIVYGTIEEKIFQRQTSKEKLSMHVVDAKRSTSKFTEAFLKEIFTFNKKIDSFAKGDDIETLRDSWLDLVEVQIEMVKRMESDWNEIKEEECKMVHPQNELVEPRVSTPTKAMPVKRKK